MSAAPNEGIMKRQADVWQDDSVAKKFAVAENATRPFAKLMVRKAGFDALEGGANVFDLGCGTGAVAAALYDAVPREKWSQVKVLGGDVSAPMLEYLKKRGEQAGWTGLETAIVDGKVSARRPTSTAAAAPACRPALTATKDIQLSKETYTHVFSNFTVFILPSTAVPTCFSLLRPGGRIGISSWARFPWYNTVSRAISRLPAPQPVLPPYSAVESAIYQSKPWNRPEHVATVLRDAGFVDVEVVEEKHRVDCSTPAVFADTMSMPLNMIAGFWPEETRMETLKAVQEELRKVAAEDAGGEEETYYVEFEGIVGVGRKPA